MAKKETTEKKEAPKKKKAPKAKKAEVKVTENISNENTVAEKVAEEQPKPTVEVVKEEVKPEANEVQKQEEEVIPESPNAIYPQEEKVEEKPVKNEGFISKLGRFFGYMWNGQVIDD